MSSSKRYALAAWLLCLAAPAWAAEDLKALEVQGERGQSLEQGRRDRYECHTWAVEQTGETPVAVPADERESRQARRDRRGERVERVIIGAVIGAGVGSLFSHGRRHDDGDGALVGAAAGAAIGAATAGGEERAAADEAAEPSDYLRALTACLEGRGYSVHLPTEAELTASR